MLFPYSSTSPSGSYIWLLKNNLTVTMPELTKNCFYLFVYFWKYRNTEFNTESLDERHKKAICFLSEHMIESSNILECEKNDYDNQKVPHGQEGPKKLNLLNYFDNFFIGCGRIFAKIWYLRMVLGCWYLRRFTLFSQVSMAS